MNEWVATEPVHCKHGGVVLMDTEGVVRHSGSGTLCDVVPRPNRIDTSPDRKEAVMDQVRRARGGRGALSEDMPPGKFDKAEPEHMAPDHNLFKCEHPACVADAKEATADAAIERLLAIGPVVAGQTMPALTAIFGPQPKAADFNAFCDKLRRLVESYSQPNLGLATTREILEELAVRGEVHGPGLLKEECDKLISHLTHYRPDMLTYRTVDHA